MWSGVSTLAYRLISPCAAASSRSSAVAASATMASSLDFDGIPAATKKTVLTKSTEEASTKKPAKPAPQEEKESDEDLDQEDDDAQTVVSAVSHVNGKKKSKKRKNPFGDATAKHLCEQAGVFKKTSSSLKMINTIVMDLATTVAEKAISFALLQKRSTLQDVDIQAAVRDAFHTEVFVPDVVVTKKKATKKAPDSKKPKIKETGK